MEELKVLWHLLREDNFRWSGVGPSAASEIPLPKKTPAITLEE